MPQVTGYTALVAALLLITSCSGGGGATASSSPGSGHTGTTPPPSSSSQVSAPAPTTFRSRTYGYAVTLPGDWTSIPASAKWDGRSGWTNDSSFVDQFIADNGTVSWGVAAPWTRDLAAYTAFLITENYRYHGDSCPLKPNTRSPVTIGGQPGVLLAYDCGILINIAATVHRGVGYWFAFRDTAVAAATFPADHATFLKILRSVKFPD